MRPLGEARQDLKLGARQALEKRAAAKAVRLAPPITAGFRAIAPLTFESLRSLPGYSLKDDLVTFDAASIGAVYQGMNALYNMAKQFGENAILNELRQGKSATFARMDSVFIARWLSGEDARRK